MNVLEDSQDRELKAFFSDICESRKSKDEESVIGTISALTILLSSSRSGYFDEANFRLLVEFVYGKRDSPSLVIQKTVIDALPVMAESNPKVFVSEFFDKTIAYLLNRIAPAKAKHEPTCKRVGGRAGGRLEKSVALKG